MLILEQKKRAVLIDSFICLLGPIVFLGLGKSFSACSDKHAKTNFQHMLYKVIDSTFMKIWAVSQLPITLFLLISSWACGLLLLASFRWYIAVRWSFTTNGPKLDICESLIFTGVYASPSPVQPAPGLKYHAHNGALLPSYGPCDHRDCMHCAVWCPINLFERNERPDSAVDQLGGHALQLLARRPGPFDHLATENIISAVPRAKPMAFRLLCLYLLYILRICGRGS